MKCLSYLVVQHNLTVFGINSPTKRTCVIQCEGLLAIQLLYMTHHESLAQATRFYLEAEPIRSTWAKRLGYCGAKTQSTWC